MWKTFSFSKQLMLVLGLFGTLVIAIGGTSLSLNAVIEAEKAGEYGRGFTVVAREIRRLADQTASATLDIEQMVKDMQSAVASGVMEMDKFIAEVRQSAEDVSTISSQLSQVIEHVRTLTPNIEQVNVAMSNQSDTTQSRSARQLFIYEKRCRKQKTHYRKAIQPFRS